MKRWNYCILLLGILALTSCYAGNVQENNLTEPGEQTGPPQEEVVYEVPRYQFEYMTRSDCFVREDTGEESAFYSYSLPTMRVANEAYLTETDCETASRNVAAFNQRMNEVIDEFESFGKEMMEEQKFLVETENVSFAVCDEVDCSTIEMGQIISVVAQCYYYGGGAHPNSYTVTYTFDLSVGQFIDPAQIGDDPEHFRIAAAELLVQHAESLGEEYTSGFWTDYPEIISRWNETAVLFTEEGMTVIFSAYELGPYAMGPVELTLGYEELTDVIGEGGLSHLGVTFDAE